MVMGMRLQAGLQSHTKVCPGECIVYLGVFANSSCVMYTCNVCCLAVFNPYLDIPILNICITSLLKDSIYKITSLHL